MEDLIKALLIFKKYKNEQWPTHCEHDTLMIVGIDEEELSEQDKQEVTNLGFHWSNEYDSWVSYKFGSA